MTIFNAELHAGRTRNTFLDAHPELYSLLCRIAPRTRSKTPILFQNHLILERSSIGDVSAPKGTTSGCAGGQLFGTFTPCIAAPPTSGHGWNETCIKLVTCQVVRHPAVVRTEADPRHRPIYRCSVRAPQ